MNLHNIHPFPSKHIPPRNVDIWLPPDYAQVTDQRHPVLYMHDGQNLFDPELSFSRVDWGVDGALQRLLAAGRIPPPIVVGIWNSDNRLGEYMPEKPLDDPAARKKVNRFLRRFRGKYPFDLSGDAYLAFIVEELKPWVDAEFRTQPDQADTHIAGSSMGGLISLYAICRYPQVFCGAGCVSTAWNFGHGGLLPWFGEHLPNPASHRLYFDLGTKETSRWWMDQIILKDQRKMDAFARQAGYVDGDSLLTLVVKGARHHESAWRQRVEGMIGFLMG